MSLKLMYITNSTEIAKIAEDAGVDRIFVDMEYIGKSIRQGGMDTVQSSHTIEDISNIRKVISKAELLVRCNPIHDRTIEYMGTESEIKAIIQAGADVIMLPYFKTANEVKRFISAVDGRSKTMLLFESPESIENINEILSCDGIDEVYIGLNDLSLGYKKKFMFEILADGTVEKICRAFNERKLPYGFGGIASLGKGDLPSEHVIMEHCRLGSTCAILSRSFCNTSIITDIEEIKNTFSKGIEEIRNYEELCQESANKWEDNRILTADIIAEIVSKR